MKKFVNKQKNCLWTIFSLVLICEILLKIDNRIVQSIGIGITPLIVICVILLIKNDSKKERN